jgi:lambda family phage portal protein
MNFLDKAISYVAPKAALARLAARQRLDRASRPNHTPAGGGWVPLNGKQQLGYDGARRGGRMDGWRTSATSSNAENNLALPTLRDRSRDHVRNSGIAKKGRNEFRTKLVGTGITGIIQGPSEAVVAKANKLWKESWKKLSADGLPNAGAMQGVGASALFESGEYLIRRRVRRSIDGLAVPVQFQILECDLLDHLKNGPLQNGHVCINGVEFDALGQRYAYWMFPGHPGDAAIAGVGVASWQSKPIPASEISHVYQMERPGQVRGVPHVSAIMNRLRDREDLVEAELVRKKGEACIMAFVAQKEGDGMPLGAASATTNSATGSTQRQESLEPGMIVYGRDGEEIRFNSPQASGEFEAYKRNFDRDIAAGVMMPYEILSGDLSTVNYSSYRGGLLSFRDYIEDMQWNVFIPKHCDWIFDRWLEVAVLAGQLPADVELSIQWQPPAFDLLDRGEEAKADREMVRTGSMTWPEMVMRQGQNPEDVLATIKTWNKKFDDAGVVLDCDPRRVTNQGQQQREGNNDTSQPAKQ